mmetsp:Transcript_10542/g.15221  ORF Transcript_10542/g.15221 Transcript_10542/m.15221 type:complete len:120 (-) Transcript_10542:10-369(-)
MPTANSTIYSFVAAICLAAPRWLGPMLSADSPFLTNVGASRIVAFFLFGTMSLAHPTFHRNVVTCRLTASLCRCAMSPADIRLNGLVGATRMATFLHTCFGFTCHDAPIPFQFLSATTT